VADGGPGIPEAERARVFDRFYRLPGAPGSGSGLGLAIVRAIAERHGAEVALGDTPGGGLTIRVTFPAAERADAAPSPAPGPPSPWREDAGGPGPERSAPS
jgi:two-component system, OmpR family, sensor kinase